MEIPLSYEPEIKEQFSIRSIGSSFRNKFIKVKVVVMRTTGYMALINSFMILFLTISKLKDTGWVNFDLGIYIIPIFIVFVGLIALFGYFEMYVWKGLHEEQKIQYELTPSHPDIQEVKDKVNYIYNKLHLEEESK